MSIKVNIKQLSSELRKKIAKELEISIKPKKSFGMFDKNKPVKTICPFTINQENVILPFSYALNLIEPKGKEDKEGKGGKEGKYDYRPEKKDIDIINIKFTGSLRPHQKQVKDEAIKILNSTSSVILSLYPGYGKTCMSIYIASKIAMKTCIIVHRINLIGQWKESIDNFCPGAITQILSSKSKRNNEADFYIINAINTEKLPQDFFKGIGLVIVDELHTIVSDVLSRSFFCIQPRFLIGLSATPYRSDGLDVVIDLFFGKNKIIKELKRKHTVYKIETGFVPDVKTDMNGKIIWNSILESQSTDEQRNKIIIDITIKFKDRNFLILCKRVYQAKYLEQKLKELNQTVTTLVGSNNNFDKTSRILIATVQKAGVGFSHDILNSLIIASDMEEYFIQYLGRVIRTEDGVPIVFDLVDDHPTLKRHFNARKKIYNDAGGEIVKYNLESLI
jgi:superfamily II DNA or RNA helicase